MEHTMTDHCEKDTHCLHTEQEHAHGHVQRPEDIGHEPHKHHHEHHHDHQHKHHHEHSDGCECGCHDHDHEHSHEHEEAPAGFKVFEVHIHEGAAVCSFEKETARDKEHACAALRQLISSLSDWINANDGLIGHIKGYVRPYASTITFSTTGTDINEESFDRAGAFVSFAAIIIGIDAEELEQRVLELSTTI